MHAIERFLARHPYLSGGLFIGLGLMVLSWMGLGDLESERITAQQHAEMRAWEEGFRQGQAATEPTRDRLIPPDDDG